MFKKILLASVLFALVVPATSAKAQWATSGNNIYNTNSGNVGVGGSSTQFGKFDVWSVTGPVSRVTWSNDTSFGRFTLGQGSVPIGSLQALGTSFPDSSRAGNVDLIDWNPGGDITFWTYSTGTVSEKVRITDSGDVGIGTNNPGARLEVADGVIKSVGNRGTVTTQSISAIGWYSQPVVFAYPWGTTPTVVLTQNNSGSGDISIISFRIKKNTMTTSGFTIEYYVNAIPTIGTTKFNWLAIE